MNLLIALISIICLILSGCSPIPKSPNSTTKENALVIGFAGDTMLGRLVDETLSQMDPKVRYTYPWGNMLQELHKTDLNIVNLETTLTRGEQKVPKVFNYKATPDKVKALQAGQIDVVSLANNHSRDFADEGLLETIATLDAAGIKHVGAGNNINEARAAVILEKNGIKIGIVGFTDNEPGWLAAENKPGINYIEVGDIEAVKKTIKPVRPKVDILITTIHWGPNMRERPTQEFINFAHQMLDAGIDIIHGHSAHIFQGIEVYKKKLIMYDTGDFVDDYAVDPVLRNDRSFLFNVTVDKIGPTKVELIPAHISNMQVNQAEGNEKDEIIKRMQLLSAEFGTMVENDGTIVIN